MGRRVLHKWRRKQIGVCFIHLYYNMVCIYPYHKVTHFIMYISIVRAHELNAFKGKRPQLFEGEIEPNDLCQGAVGDCWLVAAFACASEFPDSIRRMCVARRMGKVGSPYRTRTQSNSFHGLFETPISLFALPLVQHISLLPLHISLHTYIHTCLHSYIVLQFHINIQSILINVH